jgi:uridine kinase
MPDVDIRSNGVRRGSSILAVAGGSCSGKTTLSNMVVETVGPGRSTIIRIDDYYRADLLDSSVGPVNFDVPTALDFELLLEQLAALKQGHRVAGPIWDFVNHCRRQDSRLYEPKEVVVVEGIFALHSRPLCDLYDHSCFIECPEDIRLERRIVRDIAERGRTEWSVREQFQSQVAPMHDEFVEPTKHMARRIVSQSEYCSKAQVIVDELLKTLATAR